MNIELLYIKNCPNFRKARRLIHDTIKSLGLNIPLRKTEIKDKDDAREYSFSGSPTIRINGKDIEPETASATGLTCRIYNNGTGLPDSEILKCKIAKAAGPKTVLFVRLGFRVSIKGDLIEAFISRYMHTVRSFTNARFGLNKLQFFIHKRVIVFKYIKSYIGGACKSCSPHAYQPHSWVLSRFKDKA